MTKGVSSVSGVRCAANRGYLVTEGVKKRFQQKQATSKLNNLVQIATLNVNCVGLSTTHLVGASRTPH